MPTEPARLEWLAAHCVGDGGLFQEVSTLLEAWAQMEGASQAVRVPPPPTALFGPYMAVRLLGRGGMSAVYLAERADGQYQKTVALMVMAGYLADPLFFLRFEAERQFLAALNHHNITRLLDGGVSSGGDPFLVTEYVNGETIDRYCEQRKLAISARLPIFLQVCEAVDYAHRNLIVHRDLKPANILVNGEGTVKLLDFGTASLTETSQNDRTITRLRMLTPRYASPEQLRGERVNISTDVFSLGVILYELLAGAWPFGDPKSMLREIDRASGQMTANPPSTGITEEAAETRSTSREQLSRTLKGDLSAIVLKALESEPSRRYESVRALAADLENFLAGRPVEAKPATLAYRAAKFVGRNRLAVAAAAVFVHLLIGATLFSLYQANAARKEARRAERINKFMNGVLGAADPGWYNTLKTKGQNVTVLDVLTEMRSRIGPQFGDDPEVEIRLRRTIGRTFAVVGKHAESRDELEIALRRQLQMAGPDHPDTAQIYRELSAEDYQSLHTVEGLEHARAAVNIFEKTARSEDREGLMESYNLVAVNAYGSGHPLQESEDAQSRALAISRELFGKGGATPVGVGALESLKLQAGKFEEAETLLKEAMDLFRAGSTGPGYESNGMIRDQGIICMERGDYPCAITRLEEAYKGYRESAGEASLYLNGIRIFLGLSRGLNGQPAEGLRELDDVAARYVASGGSGAAQFLASVDEDRGRLHMAMNQPAAAEPEFRRALAYVSKNRSGWTRNEVLRSRLGECLAAEGKNSEAIPMLSDSLNMIRAQMGPAHIWTRGAEDRLKRVSASK